MPFSLGPPPPNTRMRVPSRTPAASCTASVSVPAACEEPDAGSTLTIAAVENFVASSPPTTVKRVPERTTTSRATGAGSVQEASTALTPTGAAVVETPSSWSRRRSSSTSGRLRSPRHRLRTPRSPRRRTRPRPPCTCRARRLVTNSTPAGRAVRARGRGSSAWPCRARGGLPLMPGARPTAHRGPSGSARARTAPPTPPASQARSITRSARAATAVAASPSGTPCEKIVQFGTSRRISSVVRPSYAP